MKFVSPEFLWASALIAIPIIVHLFNFRRYKIVYFSRVKYLKEVTEDSKSGLKLKHLLVLLSRILTILFLVFAFAQPFIPSENQQNVENTSLIYIDNSYSMQAEGNDGNLLNEVKNKAIELVKTFEKNEKVVLVTTDLLSDQFRLYSPEDVVESIKKIKFSPRSTPLTNILNAQLDIISESDLKFNNRIFLFSDFQKTTHQLSEFKRKEIPCFYYQAKANQPENIYIDSVWFESPVHRIDIPTDVFFRIQNKSEVTQNDLTVSLQIDKNQPAPKRITVEANSSATGSFNFTDKTAGIKSGTVSVSTSQLYFDDSYHFSYEIKNEVQILIVRNDNSTSRNLEQLYGVHPYYHFTSKTIDNVTQEDFKNKELVVFQNVNEISGGIKELIQTNLKDGSSIVLIPGLELDKESWNGMLNELNFPTFGNLSSGGELTYFNSADPIYYGVFETTPTNYKFPEVSQSYSLQIQSNQNFITLFGFHETKPYLIYGNRSNGRLILMGSPLDLSFTNFQNHALFAASYLRFAETSSFQKPLSMTMGEMPNLPFKQAVDEKKAIHLMNEEMKVDFIPQLINTGNTRFLSFAQMQDKIQESGFYKLTDQENYNDILALNYSRFESDITSLTPEEIESNFSKIGWTSVSKLEISDEGSIESSQFKPREYWRLCLILSLLFIAVEILLLKLWKS